MTKLILTALMFCSSLSLAAEVEAPSTAPQKKKPTKPSKVEAAAESTAPSGLGTGGLSTASPKKAAVLRGTGSAPQK